MHHIVLCSSYSNFLWCWRVTLWGYSIKITGPKNTPFICALPLRLLNNESVSLYQTLFNISSYNLEWLFMLWMSPNLLSFEKHNRAQDELNLTLTTVIANIALSLDVYKRIWFSTLSLLPPAIFEGKWRDYGMLSVRPFVRQKLADAITQQPMGRFTSNQVHWNFQTRCAAFTKYSNVHHSHNAEEIDLIETNTPYKSLSL